MLLINAVFFKNNVYGKQALSLLLGLSIILVPNVIYITGLVPAYKFDITPVFFGPAGLITMWGMFRFKLFDIIPVAWATVVKTMDTGVMVLDLQNRVLDINPGLEKILGCTASAVSTKQAEEACRGIPDLARVCRDKNVSHTEFTIHANGLSKVYEALLSPLADSKCVLIGRLVIIYEVTEKKLAQQVFLKQQWKLAVNEERERMARDLHDNLGQVLGFINLQAQGIRQELKMPG